MSASDADQFEREAEFDEQDNDDDDEEEAHDNVSHNGDDEEDDDDDARDRSASQEEEAIDERFIERVPVKKPVVSSVALRLPSDLLARVEDGENTSHHSGGDTNKDDGADTANSAAAVVDVQLHLTRPAYAFEKVCRKALNEMRRANVMRQLAQDVDGLRAFVDHEQARRRLRDENGLTEEDELAQGIAPEALDEMEEILEKIQRAGAGLAMRGVSDRHQDDDGRDGAGIHQDESGVDNASVHAAAALDAEEDGEEKAPLYWLTPLISNDVPTLERTLAAMYGWAVPPLPPPKPPRTVSFAGRKRVGGSRSGDGDSGDDDEDDEDEEGEDLVVPDPARARPSWFKPSGAFGGEGGDGEAASHDEVAAETDGRETDAHESVDVSAAADPNEEAEWLGTAAAAAARTSTSRPHGSTAAGSHRGSSAYIAPMHGVPAFGDVNRLLWIVYDTASEAWHLLDEHPLLRTLRCRLEKATGGAPRAKGDADQDEEAAEEEEEEDVSDEEGEGSDDDSQRRRRRRRLAGVPDYRLDAMLPVDAVVLAALFCPAALRLCLLQRRQPSLARVEEWLWRDLDTGFPLLTTVHSAIVASRATDGPRLPYPLPPMTLDFNIFFCEPFLTGANNNSSSSSRGGGGDALKNSHRASGTEAALSVSTKGSRPHSGKVRTFQLSLVRLTSSQYAKHLLCHEKQVNLISSSLSHAGRYNMEMLLAAGVFPSRPVRLAAFASTEGVRLALWLLMAMPRTVLVRWGFHAAGGRGVGEDEENEHATAQDLDWYGKEGEHPGASLHQGEDDEEDEEVEDEEDIPPEEETIEMICERITRQQRRQARERRALEGPLLRLAPFPMALVLEVRRRVAREMKTKPPSQLTLLAAVGHCFKLGQMEDGKSRGDPLLTANFRLALPTPVSTDEETTTTASEAAAATNTSDSTQRFRHQRLYQSDLVLLLLALTSTPQPRGVVTARIPGPQNLKKPSPPAKEGGNAPGTTPSTHNNPSSAARGTHWSEKTPGAAAAANNNNNNGQTERGGSILSSRGPQAYTDTLAASGHSGLLLSPRQAPGHASFSVSEPAPAVSLRRRSLLLLQGSPSDAHEALFTEILAAKMEKANATPLTLLRSGTLRLLLRALPRFCQQRVMEAFCESVPLYQVLGQTESSPLPELVDNWSAELAKALKLEQVTGMVQHRYLDAFTNRFWHELNCRLAGGLYGRDTVPLMQRQLAVLFDKIDERLKQYQDTMSSLGGVVHIDHHGGTGMTSMNASTVHDGRRLYAAGPMGTRRFTGRTLSLVSMPLSGRAAGAAGTSGFGSPGTADLPSVSARRTGPSVVAESSSRQKSVSGASLRLLPGAGRRQSMFSMNSVEPAASTTIAVAAAAAAAASTSYTVRPTAVKPPLPPPALASGRQLSVYDAEFKRELTRVRALLSSLPMFPSTYITPYTLFALLFGDTDPSRTSDGGSNNKVTSGHRGVDLAAVYYIVVVQGITTVQADPFFGVEMPALEYAVRELNVAAARVLVQLGASMQELIEGGAMTIEQYCELMLAPEEVEELRQVADIYTHHVTTNPDAHYGILRNVRSGAVGV